MLRLFILILRRGRWRHRGHDYSQERMQALQALTGKVPENIRSGWWQTTWLWKNPVLRMAISQVAYFCRCVTPRGGHLTHPSGVAYIRLPKSASTSLSATILPSRYPGIHVAQLTSTEINFLADACLQNQFEPGLEYFTVVRHPLLRLASVYRDFFQKPGSAEFIYEDYLFGILRRDMSFAEFVRTVEVIPDFLKDQHLKPQTYLLRYYEKKTTVRVFKLEDVEELKGYLQNLAVALPHLNASADGAVAVQYDARTLDIACCIYQHDLLRWNYTAEGLSK